MSLDTSDSVARRVMGVSFEPWETRLMLDYLASISEAGDTTCLMVGDPWQVDVVRARSELRTAASERNVSTICVFDKLNRWRWMSLIPHQLFRGYGTNRTTHVFEKEIDRRLILSDVMLNPEERRASYLPMTASTKKFILEMVTHEIYKAIDDFCPDYLVMIEDNYLAKNVAAEIARLRKCPTVVVRSTRIGHGIHATPFWPSKDSRNPRAAPSTEGFAIRAPLYRSQSLLDYERLMMRRTTTAVSVISECVSTLRKQARDIRKGRRTVRAFVSGAATACYASSRMMSAAGEVAKVVRRARFAAGHHGLQQELPQGRYLLIPLHYRPESSTLTLGRGMRDEDVVEELHRALESIDLDIELVALENPSSIGDSRMALYRHFNKHGAVVLSPEVDTFACIRGATGVVGISGTALLEAELLGIPAYAFGVPPFRPWLSSATMEIEEFLSHFLTRSNQFPPSGVREYVEELANRQVEAILGWDAIASPESQAAASAAIRGVFTEALQRPSDFTDTPT